MPGPDLVRLLLVDDDPRLVDALRKTFWLDRPQWRITTACNGEEAFRLLKGEAPDVLATDIHMPGMDGMSLLARIREDPELATLPVILITARNDRSSMRTGMVSGADDYLTKPFTSGELIQAVEARLRRRPRPEPVEGEASEIKALLTSRELDVLAMVGRGLVNKDIAVHLGLSFRTVAVHRANIMRKLDLHNAAALAALATRARVN